MKYPDRIVPFFSVGETKIQCRQVQSFFDKIDVDKGTGNCLLSQLQNYICGCEGAGYAGANTVTKQRALVWMPRVSALLSIMVMSAPPDCYFSFYSYSMTILLLDTYRARSS